MGAGKLIAALVDQAENEQNERRIQEEARIAAEEEVKRIAGWFPLVDYKEFEMWIRACYHWDYLLVLGNTNDTYNMPLSRTLICCSLLSQE